MNNWRWHRLLSSLRATRQKWLTGLVQKTIIAQLRSKVMTLVRSRESAVTAAAESAINRAMNVQQLRQALTILLPSRHGLSVQDTAATLGISVSWASRLRASVLKGTDRQKLSISARGGRRNEVLSAENEAQLVAPFVAQWRAGHGIAVDAVQLAVRSASGRSIARSTVYKMLQRHGWHG